MNQRGHHEVLVGSACNHCHMTQIISRTWEAVHLKGVSIRMRWQILADSWFHQSTSENQEPSWTFILNPTIRIISNHGKMTHNEHESICTKLHLHHRHHRGQSIRIIMTNQSSSVRGMTTIIECPSEWVYPAIWMPVRSTNDLNQP